jgi:phosphonate transport system substrate-binding protein
MPAMAATITLASYLAENARPTYERIAAYVGRRLGSRAELVAGASWDERLGMLDDGRVQVGFICGWPYSQRFDRPDRPIELLCAPVMAAPRYQGRPIYFTDVIVRADSALKSFADLRGRSYAYNGVESHSGYNVPRDHLLALGETSGYFARTMASGSHQASIALVAEGSIDSSGIDSTVLDLELARRPELAAALRVVETVGPGPIPPVVVARGLPDGDKARLREVFLSMHDDGDGQAILREGLIARFVTVSDADYDPIRAMVRRAETAGFLILR